MPADIIGSMSSLTMLPGANALAALSRVTLRATQQTRDGRQVPQGSSGTVVEVLGQGRAYMVEFGRPFHALVTVEARDVMACAEV